MSDEDLPDPLQPGRTAPHNLPAELPETPRGDVRVATWIALLSAVLVVAWYVTALLFGGIHTEPVLAGTIQIAAWLLAAVSFVCGLVCLNARRYREFAAAGFIAGIVALLVTLTIGLSAGLQLLF